jgi:hypothetical protein
MADGAGGNAALPAYPAAVAQGRVPPFDIERA